MYRAGIAGARKTLTTLLLLSSLRTALVCGCLIVCSFSLCLKLVFCTFWTESSPIIRLKRIHIRAQLYSYVTNCSSERISKYTHSQNCQERALFWDRAKERRKQKRDHNRITSKAHNCIWLLRLCLSVAWSEHTVSVQWTNTNIPGTERAQPTQGKKFSKNYTHNYSHSA